MTRKRSEWSEANVVAGIRGAADAIAGLEQQARDICAFCRAVVKTLRAGGKVLTAGNGGSAAEALHLAEELVGRYRGRRRSLPAVSLAADPTTLTCIANDFGYEEVFARQVEGLGRRGDLLVLFSTSGKSANLPPALRAARRAGMRVAALLGRDGGSLAGRADAEVIVPGSETAHIQEAHQVILHLALEAVEKEFA